LLERSSDMSYMKNERKDTRTVLAYFNMVEDHIRESFKKIDLEELAFDLREKGTKYVVDEDEDEGHDTLKIPRSFVTGIF